MVIVDEHTRYTWTYPLKRKNDAEEIYKTFEQMVLTQFSKKIKKLKCRVPVRSGWVAQRGVSTRPSRVVGLDRVGRVLGGLWGQNPGSGCLCQAKFLLAED